jgi:apolipoprotein D and lipocalin family protein
MSWNFMKNTIASLLLVISAFNAAAQEPMTTVPGIDVPRYLGTWYEIAKFPNRFQKMCASNTSAQYSARPDGTLSVRNRCTDADGKLSEVEGQARQIGSATSPKLEVRFAPAWLSFLPFVWGGYWVIDIDADYQLVAVSEPKREFLWVLSRTPTVSGKAYDELLVRLRAKSLDTTKLERTRHGP